MRDDQQPIVKEIGLGGFRYLVEKNKWVRCLWLSVILVFLALTTYQIFQQIQKYASNPVSTNVEIEYREQVAFPAIAICNNNQFRQSYLLDKDLQNKLFPVVTTAALDDDALIDAVTSPYFEQVITAAADWPAVEFLRHATHDIKTMLAGCILPNGTRFTPEMWTQFWTLDGICWALNLDLNNTIEITNSGKKHGLQLVLNAESYERTDTCGRVANDQAEIGFRVLIFDQNERPITTSEGIGVSPGMSVNLPFKIKNRKKLPGPSCQVASSSSSINEIKGCLGQLVHEKFEKQCNCSLREFLTKEKSLRKECDLDLYFSCMLPYQRRLQANLSAEIGVRCQPACESTEYLSQQEITFLPKQIFPLTSNKYDLTKKNLSVPSIEKQLIRVEADGRRVYKKIPLQCQDSAYVTQNFTDAIVAKVRFVLEELPRVDLPTFKTTLLLLRAYRENKRKLASRGWPFEEKLNESYPIIDMLIKQNNECIDVVHILKNESDSLKNLRSFDFLLKKKPSDVVNWELLKKFDLDFRLTEYMAERIKKNEFADLIHDTALVPFFHEEFPKYWTQPIMDFLWDARKAIKDDGKQLIEILMKKVPLEETNLTTCILEKLPAFIATQLEDFRFQSQQLGIAFDAVFKDYFGEFRQKSRINSDFERENIAIVNIYLQSNAVETWTQNADYTFWTLACDVGGALGLFLGASVVTILEIIYIFYEHYEHWKRPGKQKRVAPDQPLPHNTQDVELKMKKKSQE